MGDQQRGSPLRKKVRLAFIAAAAYTVLFPAPGIPLVLPNATNHDVGNPSGLDAMLRLLNLAAGDDDSEIIYADEYSADPRRKSEQIFWDVYLGDADDFYKDYRMSRDTFNQIVKDSVPYLYVGNIQFPTFLYLFPIECST
jgi:hypothetical protein